MKTATTAETAELLLKKLKESYPGQTESMLILRAFLEGQEYGYKLAMKDLGVDHDGE